MEGADVSSESEDKAVEADAEAPESESVEENAAESPPAVEEDDDKKTDSGFQSRIDKLTKNFRESERAGVAKDERITELEKQVESLLFSILTLYDEKKQIEIDNADRLESFAVREGKISEDESNNVIAKRKLKRLKEELEIFYKRKFTHISYLND